MASASMEFCFFWPSRLNGVGEKKNGETHRHGQVAGWWELYENYKRSAISPRVLMLKNESWH